MQSNFNTQICRLLDIESGTREGGSRYNGETVIPRQLELTRDAVDQELSAKIESELQLEKEMRDSEKLPSSLQDYLDSSSFEVSLRTPLVLELILKIRSSTTPQAKKKSS